MTGRGVPLPDRLQESRRLGLPRVSPASTPIHVSCQEWKNRDWARSTQATCLRLSRRIETGSGRGNARWSRDVRPGEEATEEHSAAKHAPSHFISPEPAGAPTSLWKISV